MERQGLPCSRTPVTLSSSQAPLLTHVAWSLPQIPTLPTHEALGVVRARNHNHR